MTKARNDARFSKYMNDTIHSGLSTIKKDMGTTDINMSGSSSQLTTKSQVHVNSADDGEYFKEVLGPIPVNDAVFPPGPEVGQQQVRNGTNSGASDMPAGMNFSEVNIVHIN